MTGNTYLSQMKILYVEDDDDTREDLRRYLKKKAGKVITAANGKEGLVKYAEERPDIVIASGDEWYGYVKRNKAGRG